MFYNNIQTISIHPLILLCAIPTNGKLVRHVVVGPEANVDLLRSLSAVQMSTCEHIYMRCYYPIMTKLTMMLYINDYSSDYRRVSFD